MDRFVTPQPDPWTWWYRTVLLWLFTVDLVIGVTLCTPHTRFFNTPALMQIHRYTFGWPVWGALWLLAGVLLVADRWWPYARVSGYFLGGVLAEFFALYALGYNVFAGRVGNVIVLMLSTCAGLLYFAGIRYQLILLTRPKVVAAFLKAD